jgi:RNA polymerase sigma-70 factor (ECF subfamily)
MSQLIDQYQLYRVRTRRDADAFASLYDRYITSIYRFVYLKLPSREAAEDVTSETFLRFWNAILQNTEIRNVRAFLYQIARNLVVDFYRKEEAQKQAVVTTDQDYTSTVNEGLISDRGRDQRLIEARVDLRIVLERIEKLKEDYRDVLTLRLIDGLGFADIALVLDKTPGHVRVIYHRAIKALDKLSP